MFHADGGTDPDVRTVEERVPSLDPLRGRAKGGSDGLAVIVGLARVGLRASLWVGGAQRGDADAERRASPNVVAVDVVVKLLDLTRGKSELGLDGRASLTSGVAVGLRCASRSLGILRSLVRTVGHTDWRARPDIVASNERISRLNSTRDQVIGVFDRVASIIGLGDVG